MVNQQQTTTTHANHGYSEHWRTINHGPKHFDQPTNLVPETKQKRYAPQFMQNVVLAHNISFIIKVQYQFKCNKVK